MGCACTKEKWTDDKDVLESKSVGFCIKLDVGAEVKGENQAWCLGSCQRRGWLANGRYIWRNGKQRSDDMPLFIVLDFEHSSKTVMTRTPSFNIHIFPDKKEGE